MMVGTVAYSSPRSWIVRIVTAVASALESAGGGELRCREACQQALGRRANVIVKTKTCKRIDGVDLTWADPSAARNYAEELANVILKRVPV
jgi:hypothetical protein